MPEQTGPTTLEGKAVTCLNAITHGGTSRKLFIPGENPDDFFKLLEELFAEYQPGSLNFSAMVTDLAHARWYLWRRQRSSDAAEFELHTAKPDESTWATEDFNRLRLFDRYKTEAERTFQRALRNVQNTKKEETRAEHWQAQFALQKQRFELEAQRFNQAEQQKQQRTSASISVEQAQAFLNQQAVPQFPVETLDGQRIVTQTVSVTTSKDGKVHTAVSPSNVDLGEFLMHLEFRLRQQPPNILRRFIFKGPVPAQYRWLLSGQADAALSNFETSSIIPYQTWFDVVFEQEGNHTTQAVCHLAVPEAA